MFLYIQVALYWGIPEAFLVAHLLDRMYALSRHHAFYFLRFLDG